jgi:hypothetical protein
MESVRVLRLGDVNVLEPPDPKSGTALMLECIFGDGPVWMFFDAAALQRLRGSLIMSPPPTPRALGMN